MDTITKKSHAKINLTLDILGKRPDGYHELSSVMQSISLYDVIEIRKEPNRAAKKDNEQEPNKSIKTTPIIKLTTTNPELPTDESNLVYQAADLLLNSQATKGQAKNQKISIHIKKYIPLSAGLAGGSSNCAATLLGINELLNLKIPQEQLLKIGRKLGADVPFCLMANQESGAGTARAEGIGEQLTPLPPHPPVSIVLARLPLLVSTKEVFAKYSGAIRSENQTPDMVRALATGDINKVADNLANDLTPIATGIYPEILNLITALREQKALGVNMTGSGPTVFAYFETDAAALAAIKFVGERFLNCEMFCAQPKI